MFHALRFYRQKPENQAQHRASGTTLELREVPLGSSKKQIETAKHFEIETRLGSINYYVKTILESLIPLTVT